MSDFVGSVDELVSNIVHFYREMDDVENATASKYTRNILRNGKKFILIRSGSDFLFCPIRYASYKDVTAKKHKQRWLIGNDTDDLLNANKCEAALNKIIGSDSFMFVENNKFNDNFIEQCKKYGMIPTRHKKKYCLIWESDKNITFADDVDGPLDDLIEGALQRITVNRYERDPVARQKCIEHYGMVCVVCGFDFEKRYGAIGAGFIHVHHLVDIASIGGRYQIDPVRDLRPVCPNCHAMLHQERPAMSIDILKRKIKIVTG